ncbi:MAG: hypothetical protein A2506_06375 [Elusimicrobia bacterium RIFOXYD12_FULL_66_9]|nr:MAG: hypothetical protein A2506_06375 [Elusimicrobia bacterium RIFOXYD12_FULL_66_9]
MKTLLLVLPLVLLLAGCAAMEKLDVSSLSGGYITNSQAKSLTKAATALRKSAEEISESEEYYIGRSVAAQILGRYKPLNNGALNLYVQKVAQAVSMASDRPATFKGYHVQVLDTGEVNAFAAPGGFIFVTKGMLGLVKNEDELACVLAHEVAHISKKHGLKTIQTSRLTSAFTILGTEAAKSYTPQQISQLTTAFEGAVDDVVNKLVVNGYSRDKEYEADRFAAQYARNANYDPGALKSFLERMAQASTSGGGVFKTHPGAGKRVGELDGLTPSAAFQRSPMRAKRFSASVSL